MERTSRPIVLACDEGYAMPLATALRSIVEADRGGRPFEFHVLTTGMSDAARDRIVKSLPAGSASVEWLPVDLDAFTGCRTRPHISKMTYARLLLPRVFADADRLLYLDADILVLRDMTPLWQTDLRGNAVGAVMDAMDRQLKDGEPGLESVPRVRDYFNAGVLMIDLDRWRSQRISERAMQYLAANPDSPFSDQDALNVACDGRWTPLDPAWNCQAHLSHHDVSKLAPDRHPGILHFVTAGKPWNRWVPNANAAAYDTVRSRTLFARTTVDKARDQVVRLGCALKEASKGHPGGRMLYRTLKRAWRTGSVAR